MEISAVIITYNEADRLSAALESVREVCDEIIIVDSFSSDDTLKIARNFGARTVQLAFTDYSTQKNYANSLAAYPWILSIDADERISPLLAQEILAIKSNEPETVCGYTMRRKTWYLGRFVTHSGWYPDRKLRLFKKSMAHWQGIVHERLILDGPTSALKGHLLHYTYRNISDQVARLNRYSTFLARNLIDRNIFILFLKLFYAPFFTFFRHYFLKLGILDGFSGLVIALVSAHGTALKYLKAYEAIRFPTEKENEK